MNNNYEVRGQEVWIELNRRGEKMYTIIDLADLATAMTLNGTWYPNPARAPKGKFYANGKHYDRIEKGTKTLQLHRVIFGEPGYEVHHKDNDGLNNRRSNFDHLTHIENMREQWPDRDWTALDTNLARAEEYRKERDIARAIQSQFELTRQALWCIRNGKTRGSKAALAYASTIQSAGIRTLEQFKLDHPRKGKFGIARNADRWYQEIVS